jgi:hypothetical protein
MIWLAVEPPFVQLTAVRIGSLFCVGLWGLTSCGEEPLCSSEVLQVARDLGSDRYATTAVRNCGVTTGFATVVRVGRASEPQSDATEVFVADSDHGAAVRGERGAIWMNVIWSAPGRLSVAYASKARVFKRKISAEGASIAYKAGDPLSLPAVD